MGAEGGGAGFGEGGKREDRQQTDDRDDDHEFQQGESGLLLVRHAVGVSSGYAPGTVAGEMFRIVGVAGNGWTLRFERGTLAAVQCQN